MVAQTDGQTDGWTTVKQYAPDLSIKKSYRPTFTLLTNKVRNKERNE